VIVPLIASLLQAPTTVAAESLLAARDLPAARAAAEDLTRRRPDDPRAHVLLGRVWLAWPTVGRYQALEEFRTAARLAPDDPEALYGQIEVGDVLGSDEGEAIVREAILRIFAITPDYRDCWARFGQLYHDPDIWRRAERALARHPGDALALGRRAEIALALEEPRRADSLAAEALAGRPGDESLWLVRAQAAFLTRDDAAGQAWYDSALVHADRDTAGVLWDQIWMIASPAEAARHDSLDPADAERFLRRFWDARDPNLVTPVNERIAEHYRRLTEVRRLFRLLHPFARYQRSPRYRALVATYERESSAQPVEDTGLDALAPADFLFRDLESVNDTVGRLTAYARANLSARGLVWIRHGRPDFWDTETPGGPSMPFDRWTYSTPQGPLSISFEGIPGPFGGHGDYIVAPPRNRHEARQVRALLATDGTSLPAPLSARGWSAFFRSDDAGATDLYVRAAPDTAAAVLWNPDGVVVARARGPGLLRLTAPPGSYRLGLDVDSAGVLGRAREALLVPGFASPGLALSSLALVALPPSADWAMDREATLDRMPPNLAYPAGRPLAAYAEIYGLRADSAGGGRARYTVRYRFAPIRSLPGRLLGGASPVTFEFTREAPAAGVIAERIVIEPGRVPSGRYRVTLAVTDLAANVKSQTTAIEVTIR
jgi:tetratricopeptide (TPR) repeat protein